MIGNSLTARDPQTNLGNQGRQANVDPDRGYGRAFR